MQFKLNETELKAANRFIDTCIQIEKYQATLDNERTLTFNYIFQNTSVGQCSAIECEQLEMGISLTDYNSW